jgi:hypothetical protein
MRVVCIDKMNYPELEVDKIYEADLIFHIKDEPVDWKNNYLNLKGFSEIDWFPTSHFMSIEVWREWRINKILNDEV